MDTTVTRSSQVKDASISPMPFWQALLYFGLPALLFRFFLYTGIPAFVHLGLTPFEAYIVGLTVPAAVLFAFAFGFYARDGYALTWSDLSARFRLLPLTRKDWLWSVVAFVVTFLSLGALAPTAQILISAFPALAVPDFFASWARPGGTFDMASLTQFVGTSVKGNWGFALLRPTVLQYVWGRVVVARVYPSPAGAHSRAMGLGGQWLAMVAVASHVLPLAGDRAIAHLPDHSVRCPAIAE